LSDLSYKKIARGVVIAKRLARTMSKFDIVKEVPDPLSNIYITQNENWGHDAILVFILNNFKEIMKNES